MVELARLVKIEMDFERSRVEMVRLSPTVDGDGSGEVSDWTATRRGAKPSKAGPGSFRLASGPAGADPG